MIFDITYQDDKTDFEIDHRVGKPFSLLQRLSMGGIGSERMEIGASSDQLTEYLPYADLPNFCNLELRPKGILVHLSYHYRQYAWVIPYAKSSILKSGSGMKIFGDAEFLELQQIYRSKDLEKFIKKMMQLRAEYLASIQLPFD